MHERGPRALFEAARLAGVRRILQISALGVAQGTTPYFVSKRAADEALQRMAGEWQILRPSLIYGPDGDSARMFRLLASLPLVPLPAGGHQEVQPVHVDDVAQAAVQLILPTTPAGQILDAVGPRVLRYREMLATYRAALGFEPALALPIPGALIALAAHTVGRLPGVLLTPDNWKMLQEGSKADPGAFAALLGHAPRAVEDFIPAPAR